jgi:hypothetical protein
MDPRAVLDDMEKILHSTGTQTLTLRSPAHSQTLYRLRYSGDATRFDFTSLLIITQKHTSMLRGISVG